MKILVANGQPASKADIDALQAAICHALPASFLEFIRHNDGAEPESNIFNVGNGAESGVNAFIPVRQIANERSNIDNIGPTDIPVAWAEGGNYVLIKSDSGDTLFWDHEQPESPVKLAPDFKCFLDMLEKFDISTIKLEPGQVKSAWIDPDFLKNLGK